MPIRRVVNTPRLIAIQRNLPQLLPTYFEMVKEVGEREVRRAAPRDTGELQDSVKGTVTSKNAIIEVSAEHAALVISGTRPHTIVPRRKSALWWPGAQHPVKKVEHPGTKPNDFIEAAMEHIDVDQIGLKALRKVLG